MCTKIPRQESYTIDYVFITCSEFQQAQAKNYRANNLELFKNTEPNEIMYVCKINWPL